VTVFAVAVGGVGVGDQPQMSHGPSQPGRVQPAGRLQQDWFGLGGNLDALVGAGDPAGIEVGEVGDHRSQSVGSVGRMGVRVHDDT
jgi:hypothetical protein